jgi:hypothetical protein
MKIIKHLKLSLGVILSLLCVLFLVQFVKMMEIDFEFLDSSLDNWSEFLPNLLLGIITGVIGIPLVIENLKKLD